MSTAIERLDAAKRMSVDQLLVLKCPSAEFEAEFKAINERTADFSEKAQKLQRRLELVQENKDVIELSGKDPNAEIRAIREPLQKATAGVQRGPSDLYDLLAAEKQIFELKKDAAWKTLYERFILTFQGELGEHFDRLRSSLVAICEGMTGILNSAVSSTARFSSMFADLDAAAAQFNTFRSKAQLSPQQFGVENSLRNSFCQAVRQSFAKLPMSEINTILGSIGLEQLRTQAQWRLEELQKPNPQFSLRQAEKDAAKTFTP